MTTIRKINQALRLMNADAEIIRGDGFHYFVGADVDYAFNTTVMVAHTNAKTLDEWMDCYRRVREDHLTRAAIAKIPMITLH